MADSLLGIGNSDCPASTANASHLTNCERTISELLYSETANARAYECGSPNGRARARHGCPDGVRSWCSRFDELADADHPMIEPEWEPGDRDVWIHTSFSVTQVVVGGDLGVPCTVARAGRWATWS
jgi:hypothetical protein